MSVFGAQWWTSVPCRVYFHLLQCVPRRGSGSSQISGKSALKERVENTLLETTKHINLNAYIQLIVSPAQLSLLKKSAVSSDQLPRSNNSKSEINQHWSLSLAMIKIAAWHWGPLVYCRELRSEIRDNKCCFLSSTTLVHTASTSPDKPFTHWINKGRNRKRKGLAQVNLCREITKENHKGIWRKSPLFQCLR